jgi:transposase
MVDTMKDQSRELARTRRLHDRAFKDDMVAQSLVSGASVAAIAMKGGINTNLLFKWRREHVRSKDAVARAGATLLPVCVIPDGAVRSPPPPIAAINRGARNGVIELEIAGAQLRLRGAVDEAMLSSVLRALRRSE